METAQLHTGGVWKTRGSSSSNTLLLTHSTSHPQYPPFQSTFLSPSRVEDDQEEIQGDEYTTIGGFLCSIAGEIPTEGDEIEIPFVFRIAVVRSQFDFVGLKLCKFNLILSLCCVYE